jgi:hypothetical protein
MKFTNVLLALIGLLSAGQSAHADDGALWVNAGGFSVHFNRDKGFNENNAGAGIEYRINNDVSVMAGSYNNSIRRTSNYALANWQPLSMGNWKLGAAIGLIDGYPRLNQGGAFPTAVPMLTYEGSRFGINIGVIPTVDSIEGAATFQLKFRIL